MDRTVVALFDDLNTAQQALEELLRNGFDRNDMSVVRTNQQGDFSTSTTATVEDAGSGLATGAGVGAALGGLAGLVVGLGALAIPGIGPIVAAGPLATTLAGAGIGAAAGGLIGALTDVGIPDEEAGYFAEGIRRGGTLLTVRASEDKVGVAQDILSRFSPTDVSQRAAEWRASGWTGYNPEVGATQPVEGMEPGSGMGSGISGSGSFSGTGGSSSMGLTGSSGSFSSRRFEDFDNDFRSDWQTRYSTSGYGYERYQPAYQYGWQLGERYQGRDWNDFETDVRSDWQRNHPNDAWEDFKDSVRTGWQRFKEGASDVGRDIDRGLDRAGDNLRDAGHDVSRGADRTMDRIGDNLQDAGRDLNRGLDRAGDNLREAGHDASRAFDRNFDRYDNDFRSNWETSYRSSGSDYNRYRPAYQYGYTLANETRYRGRDWNDFEMDARREWETSHPGEAWDDFKDAVRHAWHRVRSDVRGALD